MTDIAAVVQATGGPFFEARWRRSEKWYSEQYRLFRGARERCQEEFEAGADLAYVQHLVTDETVFALRTKSGPVPIKLWPHQAEALSQIEDQEKKTFEDWCELVSYMEGIDADLDGNLVPSRDAEGKRLFLKERIALLHAVATRRSQMAYKLFLLLDGECGTGLRNGYWSDLKPLWDECRKEFEIL